MIYDEFKNIGKYYGIHKNLDTAIGFMEKENLSKLPYGKTNIKEDEVFVNIMDATTKSEDEGNYEIHKKYVDIQFDLLGRETIIFGQEEKGQVVKFDDNIDFGIMECEKSTTCKMGPGKFVICMTNEPHMPGIMVDEPQGIKKGVIKVLVD